MRTGGYRITTTLDYALQQVAHKRRSTKWVAALGDKNVHNGALVAIDSATGEIVAYVGIVDYYNRKDPRVRGPVRRRRARPAPAGIGLQADHLLLRLPGARGDAGTFFVDAVTQFGVGPRRPPTCPTNADIKDHGPLLALDALRYSLNVPSVMMQYLVGVDDDGPASRSRWASPASEYIMGQDPGLTLALGSVPVNLTNMTQAYGVFAAAGHPAPGHHDPRDPRPQQPGHLQPRRQTARRRPSR